MVFEKKNFMMWLLSFFLCFSSSFTVITAEEEPVSEKEPEIQEIVEEEQSQENTETVEKEEMELNPDETAEPEMTAEEQEDSEEVPEDPVEVVEENKNTDEPIYDEPSETEEKQNETVNEEEKPEEIDIVVEEDTTDDSELFATPASEFKYTISNGEVTITLYNGKRTEIVIPSSIEGYPVRTIGKESIYGPYTLTKVVIPNSVITISERAFYANSSLTDVNIPESVTYIGDYAFWGCSLERIVVPSSVTYLGEYAFYGNRALTDITLSEGITSICDWTFGHCQSLTKITIPDSVTKVGFYAFYNCNNLISITIPNSVQIICGAAFDMCFELKNVYYSGSYLQWIRISFGEYNERLFGAQLFCAIPDEGEYAYAVLDNSGNLIFFESDDSYSEGEDQTVTDIFGTQYSGYVFTDIEGDGFVTAPWYIYKDEIINSYVVKNQMVRPKNMARWFRSCHNLKTFNSTGFDTSMVTDMSELFAFCSNLETIDLSSFNTAKIENMNNMFRDCNALETVVLGKEFTRWIDYSYLRAGVWQYQVDAPWAGESRDWDEIKLHDEYPLNAAEWSGTWKFISERDTYALKIENGTYKFVSELSGHDLKYSYDYDESWFFNDARSYNHDLSLMSLKMTMASISDSSYIYSNNIRDLYSQLKYQCVDVYYPEPEDNSVGYIIGSKNIVDNSGKEIALITITIRSGGYGSEWAGNFEIGYGDDHSGFDKGAETILSGLQRYYEKYKGHFSENVKIWISGYSRGAAIANLLAAKLDDGKLNGISTKDVFAYCFECPQNTKNSNYDSSKYDNIFSIVNPLDVVTKVAPKTLTGFITGWNYKRYGQVLTIYNELNSNGLNFGYYANYKPFMLTNYANILIKNNLWPNIQPYEMAYGLAYEKGGQAVMLDSLVSYIAGLANTSENFVTVNQEAMKGIIRKYLGKGKDENFSEDIINAIISLVAPEGIKWILKPWSAIKGVGEIYLACQLFADYRTDIDGQHSMVFRAHYPELCLAWMETFKDHPEWIRKRTKHFYNSYSETYSTDLELSEKDENEETYDMVSFAPSTNRLIYVNASADVNIYDQENNLIAQVIDGISSNIQYGLYSYIDFDGQRVFVVPDDCECRIDIQSEENEQFIYTCVEQDYVNNKTLKMISYIDEQIKEGDRLTGTVEDITDEEATAKYELKKNNEVLLPDLLLEGEEITYHTVNVNVEGDGFVSSKNDYVSGECAQLSVADGADHFLGWYENNNLISSEATYQFIVQGNRDITAKFENYVYTDQLFLSDEDITLEKDTSYQLDAVLSPDNASKENVYWFSQDKNIATVDQNGNVTAVNNGTTVIYAITKYGLELSASCSVTVKGSGIYIKGFDTSYLFTGSALKPFIEVYDNGTLLVPKTDYTITYKNTTKAYHVEDPDNPTATDKKKAPQIIIKSNSKGNYKGSKTIYFSIDPLDINDEQITVDELSVQAGTKPVSPVPTVYFNGKKLKNKTDYTVDYNGWDQLTPGDVTVKIHGKGNFQGTRDVTVHVASSDLISVAKLNVTSKTLKYAELNGDDFLNEVASAVTVKNGKAAVPEDAYFFEDIPEDYKKVGTVTFTLTGKEDKGYFGKKTVTVKITGIALTDKKVKALTGLSYPYTGEEVTFTPETHLVSYNGTDLTEGTDYVIDSYSKNVNAGTATVTLKGINSYTGTKKVNFKITPADATGRAITVEDAFYTKGGSKPKVTVEGLIEGTDFTVKYANNKAVTASNTSKLPTVTVTFKGNYRGTVTRDFYIVSKPISAAAITAKDKVYSSKANAWKSAPVLKDIDGKTLKAGTDYDKNIIYTTVEGDELPAVVEVGTIVKVTVTGKGNYTGTAETYYHILDTGKDISKMTFKIANKEYTGTAVTITEDDITNIKLGKKEQDLVLGRDYEIVSYTNNINKGTAKVTIRGLGEYGGEKTVSFKIGQRSIVDYWKGIKSIFSTLF